MGRPDQFLKQRLEDEIEAATGERVRFVLAPEIRTDHLTPDGLLMLRATAALADLPAPWPLLVWTAVTEGKMEGDHHDRLALARAEFRRWACWVRYLEPDPRDEPEEKSSAAFFQRLRRSAPRSEEPRPEWWQTWVVASRLPQWLKDPSACEPLKVTRVADGCYRIEPRDHVVLWIAANELPLHESLIPFLWARSGSKMAEFVLWVAETRGVQPVAEVLLLHPQGEQVMQKVLKFPSDDEEVRQRGLRIVRMGLEHFPQLAEEIREEGIKKGVKKGIKKGLGPLVRQFSRRLDRKLTLDERRALARRLDTLGPDRLGDVVLDLTTEQLAAWLADPDAK